MSIKVENLSFSYGKTPVLKAINFELKEGDCLAVLGANGVGKSTLLKCINRIVHYNEGHIYLNDVDTKDLTHNALAKEVGYVCQSNNFSDMSVFDAVLLGRIPHIKWDLSHNDLEIAQEMLDLLSLTECANKNVNHLSGGEKQKVAIARALAQETSLLLLDEPTSNLDIKNQMEIVEIISRISKENKISLIVSIHDLNLALSFANKFLLMKDGSIFAFGDQSILTKENIKEVYDVDSTIVTIDDKLVIIPKHNER